MKKLKLTVFLTALMMLAPLASNAQHLGVSTNVLGWASATPTRASTRSILPRSKPTSGQFSLNSGSTPDTGLQATTLEWRPMVVSTTISASKSMRIEVLSMAQA